MHMWWTQAQSQWSNVSCAYITIHMILSTHMAKLLRHKNLHVLTVQILHKSEKYESKYTLLHVTKIAYNLKILWPSLCSILHRMLQSLHCKTSLHIQNIPLVINVLECPLQSCIYRKQQMYILFTFSSHY